MGQKDKGTEWESWEVARGRNGEVEKFFTFLTCEILFISPGSFFIFHYKIASCFSFEK